MAQKLVYTATEARQNFFDMLEQARKAGEAEIVKKDQGLRFKVMLIAPNTSRKSSRKLIGRWDSIDLKSKTLSSKEIKKLILTKYD